MRCMMMYKPDKKTEADVILNDEHLAAMGKLIEEMSKAGVLLATEGLQPNSKSPRVRLSGGKLTVDDGVVTGAKELITGFALVQMKSKEEAIEWGKRFLKIARDGESEIRQAFAPKDLGAL